MLNTTEVTPTMVRLLARSNQKLLDKLIFDPAQLTVPEVLQTVNTAVGRTYHEDWLNKGVDLEHLSQLLRSTVRYCAAYNEANPTMPELEGWKQARIGMYETFVGTGRLEGVWLVHLRTFEASLLIDKYPSLGYEQCQFISDAWEQAFYRKFPKFAEGAADQFRALALTLQKASKNLTEAIVLNVLPQESANEPTA